MLFAFKLQMSVRCYWFLALKEVLSHLNNALIALRYDRCFQTFNTSPKSVNRRHRCYRAVNIITTFAFVVLLVCSYFSYLIKTYTLITMVMP